MNISLSTFVPENLVSRDGLGSPVPALSPWVVLCADTLGMRGRSVLFEGSFGVVRQSADPLVRTYSGNCM